MLEFKVTTRDRNDNTTYTRSMWAYHKGEVYDRISKFQPWNIVISIERV